MNFIKAYKYPLGITLTLIAVFFVFQNATCGGTDTTGTTSGLTGTTTGGTLALAESVTSIAVSGTDQFSASGGTPPYTYSVIAGSGSIDPNSGVFTAPANSEVDEVMVRDNAGTVAYLGVTIGNASTSTTLSLTASTYSVAFSSTVQFTATGGTSPYTYSVLSGAATSLINTQTGLFTAPANTATVTVQVVDAVRNTATATITVNSTGTGSYPTTPLSVPSVTIAIDQYLAITYANQAGATYPTLYIFGTGPSFGAGTNCSPLAAAVPCLQSVQLTNFSNSTIYQNSFRGFISVSGRGGSTNLEYCIDPSDTTKAVIAWVSGTNGLSVSTKQFLGSSGSLMLFGGATAATAFINIDGSSGAGGYTVNVTGQYSVHTNCTDLGALKMQVQDF